MGDITNATATASGAKLYVQGRISNDSAIRMHDNGGTTYHQISASATTKARSHIFQDSDGTIAHLSDVVTSSPKWSFGDQAGANAATGTKSVYYGIGDTSFNLMEIITIVDSGTTGHLEGRNANDSSIIFNIDVVGDGTETYSTTTSFTNVSGSKNRIIVDWTRISGAGSCLLFGARLF